MVPLFRNTVEVILYIYFFLILIEIGFSLLYKSKSYTIKETLCTISVAVIKRLFTIMTMNYIFSFVFFHNYALLNFNLNFWQLIPLFFIVHFLYYIHHRLNHHFGFLWSIHEVHHSSRELNLIAANRQSFLDVLVSSIYFAPICLLGFHPHFVIFTIYLILFINWHAHTTLVNKIPWLEGVVVTPSSHRIHHSNNPSHYNANFGLALMIWDRLFGTYKIEEEKISSFGIEGYHYTYNPIRLLLQGPMGYIKNIHQRKQGEKK